MNRNTLTIEQIVAEVVRRLSQLADAAPTTSPGVAPDHVSAAVAPAQSSPVQSPRDSASPALAEPITPSDALVLDARVVTTATVHGRLKGIRRVVVQPRAVVTPSVKDELRKRHIRLERQESVGAAGDVMAVASDLTVVRCTHQQDAERASATLPLPNGAREQRTEDLPKAVTAATQAVRQSDHVSVLVTDVPLAAVCLLNRSAHVRATQVGSVNETKDALQAIGVNVLVIDPRDVTAIQWNALLRLFRQDLPRGAPQW